MASLRATSVCAAARASADAAFSEVASLLARPPRRGLRRAQLRDQRHAALLRGRLVLRGAELDAREVRSQVVDLLLEACARALPGRLDLGQSSLCARCADVRSSAAWRRRSVKLRTVSSGDDFVRQPSSSSFCSLVTSDCSSVATDGVTPLTWPFM